MFDIRSLFAMLQPARPMPREPFAEAVGALERGESTAALRLLDALLRNPDLPFSDRAAANNKRGVALIALGERSAAVDAFTDALDCDERHAAALTNLGNVLLEENALEDAIDYFEAALRSDDCHALALRGLGIAFKRLGRTGDAVRALRAAERSARRAAGQRP